MAENQIPATSLAGLEKFAGTVFEGAQGKYVLDEYAYFDDTSLFSTATFQPTNGGVVAAGTEVNLFNAPVGAVGQGYLNALTLADTNLERGAQGGRFPANSAYVALAGGFYVYYNTSTANPVTAATEAAGLQIQVENPIDLFQITSNIVWSWNVGGDASPRLRYEPIKLWPSSAGVYSAGSADMVTNVAAAGVTTAPFTVRTPGLANGGPASLMRKFAFPLFFPPLVAVDCRLTVSRAFTCVGTGVSQLSGTSLAGGLGQIRVAMLLRGYKLSRIV